MSAITGRALHFVFKIGNRARNSFFFREVLGMRVLRHEEFKEGCDAQCNGPYDNRWSKTMIGYGPESSHFVFELTYNYGITSYEMGNDFGGVTIRSKDIITRAKTLKYPIEDAVDGGGGGKFLLLSPDGYKFFIIPESMEKEEDGHNDPVLEVNLNCNNLMESRKYWKDLLQMNLLSESCSDITLQYPDSKFILRVTEICPRINRAKAYGRIAFAVPKSQQPIINDIIVEAKGTILTPLISLDTPGKETVQVIILADPTGHEICFVDEEGFSKLSAEEPDATRSLDKYIGKDPFQKELDAATQ